MSSPFRNRRLALAAATLAALAALSAGIAGYAQHPSGKAGQAAPQAMPVSVATVVQADVATWDEFSGRLEAVDRVDVRSRVAGAVQEVHFREGALVRRGDLLVTIDPAPYAAEAERAHAQVVAAQARLTYAKSEHERARRLWDDRAIAQRELDSRVNARDEAEANLKAALAAQQSAQLNLSYTQVRAPVAGRVGKLEVTVGNLVAAGPGAPVLTTLVSVSPIYAAFDADEQVVARALQDIAKDSQSHGRVDRIPVEMSTAASEGANFKGHLQLVDNQVNAKSGTVRVRAVFDNPEGRLMPGQFAKVRLGRAETTPALLINERAVGTDQDKKFVMVVNADNTAAYRPVKLGANVDGLRVVSEGLKPGDRIVVGGLQRIRPGSLIAPQPMQMAQSTSRVIVGSDSNSSATSTQ
jgi:multidrug efflux system membrane fusion protein